MFTCFQVFVFKVLMCMVILFLPKCPIILINECTCSASSLDSPIQSLFPGLLIFVIKGKRFVNIWCLSSSCPMTLHTMKISNNTSIKQSYLKISKISNKAVKWPRDFTFWYLLLKKENVHSKYICIPLFIAILSTNVRMLKQPKFPRQIKW